MRGVAIYRLGDAVSHRPRQTGGHAEAPVVQDVHRHLEAAALRCNTANQQPAIERLIMASGARAIQQCRACSP